MSDVPPSQEPVVAPPPVRRSVPTPLVTAVIGLVIGAIAVGVPWLLLGGGSGGGIGGSGGITTPGTLGSLEPYQVALSHIGSGGAANARRYAADDAQSTKLLSAAYGGAPALVTRYADQTVATTAILFVVRADTPAPFVQYENLKDLGWSVPEQQVVQVGDVACAVTNETPVTSGPEPVDGVFVQYCQRTGGGLTVQVKVNGDIQHHPDQVASLVDQAWIGVR